MKTTWANKIRQGLVLVGLIGAGAGLVGCADEHYGYGYPGYNGGYYASYSRPYYPYYGGYGYPYRAYGPYYGSSYYGYGNPYYGGSTVVVSRSRNYAYRDRYGRTYSRQNANRVRNTSRKVRTSRTQIQQDQNDDERKYYTPR